VGRDQPSNEEGHGGHWICKRCCTPGDGRHRCPMPIRGRVQSIDPCIAGIVAALNAGGIETLASCCGHGRPGVYGSIVLADGRELVVHEDPNR